MTKAPYPLVDPIMIGPFIAYANIYIGELVPEYYLLIGITVSCFMCVAQL